MLKNESVYRPSWAAFILALLFISGLRTLSAQNTASITGTITDSTRRYRPRRNRYARKQ